MKEQLVQVFGTDKPIIAMLHLMGNQREEILRIAKEETEIYYRQGVTAVLAENYFGSTEDVEAVLQMLQQEYPDRVYGVNVLGDEKEAFRLARKYGAKFVQIDSVCGHLRPKDDEAYAQFLKELRGDGDIFLLGGVRFKYMPYCSGRTLEEDLQLGSERCNAIVVTGSGTGISTNMTKIEEFRRLLGDFPLIVGAGMTAETARQQLAISDGAIVGSYFKQHGSAEYMVEEARVQFFMEHTVNE